MRFRSRTAGRVARRATSAHSCLLPQYVTTARTVFRESCTANCSNNNAAATVLTCSSDGALASDPTLPYPTCGALTCFIGHLLLNGSLSGLDCAPWTMVKVAP